MNSVTGIGRSSACYSHFTHELMWQRGSVKAPVPLHLLKYLNDSRYRYVAVDLNDMQSILSILNEQSIDHVVHLAGALRDSSFRDLLRNNVEATQNLLTAVERSSTVVKFIIASSGSVYGKSASIPAVESDQCQPLDNYAVSKLTSEYLLDVHARKSPLSSAVTRIFNVIGPGLDERHLCAHLARQFAEIDVDRSQTAIAVGPLGSTRDFIDVRDVADALALLLYNRGTLFEGTFNVARGVEVRTQRIFDILGEFSDSTAISTDRQKTRKLDIDRSYANIARLDKLGFNPQYSLRESLRFLFDYYKSNVPERDVSSEGHS